MDKLVVPDPFLLAPVEELCSLPQPYASSENHDDLFLRALRANVIWHRERSPYFRELLKGKNFDPERDLQSLDDLHRLPFILANFFKKHEVLSIDKKDVFLHLTSSGTTGQKSQIFFDEWSIKSAQRMVSYIFDYYGWTQSENQGLKNNYLLMTYEPARTGENKLGTSFTDHYLCGYAPVNEVFYGLRYLEGNEGNREEGDQHRFDAFGCVSALENFSRQGLPVRIFGFPSFLYFTLQRMKELGRPKLTLHPQSLVFLGGGWKGHADKSIAKGELYSLIQEYLGIPDARIRDGFGSVEHCIPYVECLHHQFHVPVWSKVLIRDFKTLAPLGWGEKGFLQLISPYITSMPNMSVLMGDMASLHRGEDCPCEIGTPYFVVHGRAGTSKNKSCAIAASELLGKS